MFDVQDLQPTAGATQTSSSSPAVIERPADPSAGSAHRRLPPSQGRRHGVRDRRRSDDAPDLLEDPPLSRQRARADPGRADDRGRQPELERSDVLAGLGAGTTTRSTASCAAAGWPGAWCSGCSCRTIRSSTAARRRAVDRSVPFAKPARRSARPCAGCSPGETRPRRRRSRSPPLTRARPRARSSASSSAASRSSRRRPRAWSRSSTSRRALSSRRSPRPRSPKSMRSRISTCASRPSTRTCSGWATRWPSRKRRSPKPRRRWRVTASSRTRSRSTIARTSSARA